MTKTTTQPPDALDALFYRAADAGYSVEIYRRDGRWYVRLYARDTNGLEPYGMGDSPVEALTDALTDVCAEVTR